MSYRTYNLNEDIKIIFKTIPLTPNIPGKNIKKTNETAINN